MVPQPALHIDESELESYLKSHLSDGEVAALETHMAQCEDCTGKLAELDKCLAYLSELGTEEGGSLPSERRAYPRIATDEPAVLQVLIPFSRDAWAARIVDVSRGGLRTHTPKPLQPGSLIRVKMQFSIACGDVRYCIPAESGYYAGIRLHDYFFR